MVSCERAAAGGSSGSGSSSERSGSADGDFGEDVGKARGSLWGLFGSPSGSLPERPGSESGGRVSVAVAAGESSTPGRSSPSAVNLRRSLMTKGLSGIGFSVVGGLMLGVECLRCGCGRCGASRIGERLLEFEELSASIAEGVELRAFRQRNERGAGELARRLAVELERCRKSGRQ